MFCINDILNISLETNAQYHRWSLCAHLEVDLGHYTVLTYNTHNFEVIYYDENEAFPTSFPKEKEKVVACILGEENFAFVRSCMYDKFKKDSEGYGLTILSIDSFEEKLLHCDTSRSIPSFLDGIQWYDDDFLADEMLPFDAVAFEAIDSGVSYLNPKHFSVLELIAVIHNRILKN